MLSYRILESIAESALVKYLEEHGKSVEVIMTNHQIHKEDSGYHVAEVEFCAEDNVSYHVFINGFCVWIKYLDENGNLTTYKSVVFI